MRSKLRSSVAIAAILAVCLTLSAGTALGRSSATSTLIVGSTDKPISFDPAGSYDNASELIQDNVFQSLLTIPPGGSTPVPQAAKSCRFTAPTTYSCTLKPGLVFSDGKPLTSADVKYSFTRLNKINNPAAPANVFGSLASITTPSPRPSFFT